MTEVARQTYGAGSSPASGMKELFVINLCASMTPMPDVPRQLNGFEKYRLYQISKMEDGRRRYRLRMGFFTSETDAEFLVASIRSMYPAALVSCASSEDLRFAEADSPVLPPVESSDAKPVQAHAPVKDAPKEIQREAPKEAPRPVATVPVATAAPVKPVKIDVVKTPDAAPAAKAVPASAPAVTTSSTSAAPAATPAKPASEEILLTLVEPPVSISSTRAAPSNDSAEEGDTRIFHVGRGVQIPESSLELTAEELLAPAKQPAAPAVSDKTAAAKPATTPNAGKPAAAPARAAATAAPAATPTTKPVATTAGNKPAAVSVTGKPAADKPVTAKPATQTQSQSQSQSQPIVAATIQAPAAKDDYVPILDTTLTIRTLTKSEADDPNRPKWFVVQLASSERPIDISTMPKLDIFAAYSLYCVALMEQGGIRHTLRLGFFKEQVSADAVMGYLKTFFNSPCVTQISSAEHARFASDKPKKPALAAAPAAQAQPARAATQPAIKPATVTPAAKPAAPKVMMPPLHNDASKSQSFLSRLIGKQLD